VLCSLSSHFETNRASRRQLKLPVPKCRPVGVHAAKETLDEKAEREILTGPFDTGYAGVKETAKRDATPTIATRSSRAYDTLIEEAPGSMRDL
jgi:hypothetical protein